MDATQSAHLLAGQGLAGNADLGGRRQVTLIEEERWAQHMATLGIDLQPEVRRANMMVRHFPLENTRGRTVRIGTCLLRIAGETKPCHQMDAAWPGLKDAMYPRWGGGAFAEVLRGGWVAVGDAVSWQEDLASL